MTTLLRGFCVVSFVAVGLSAVGCGLFKKGGDAADAEVEAAAVAEVAEAAPPPVVLPAAANENDISRFPDEKKLENVTGTIQRVTNVREIPGIGKIVTTLAKGGTVTEIAQRGTFFLVVFENPKDQKKLMGWISQDSFTAQADAGIIVIKCTAPETALISDGTLCGRVCTVDTDCVAGQACKGVANRLLANGSKGDAVRVCTISGAPPAAVVPTPATPTAPVPVVVKPQCGAGSVLVTKDNQCHKSPCKIGVGCPADQPLCVACQGTTICVAPGARNLCK